MFRDKGDEGEWSWFEILYGLIFLALVLIGLVIWSGLLPVSQG